VDHARVWKEGVVAGLLGAAGVAFWFLIVDLVAGAALATPEMLGRTLLSVLGKGIGDLHPMANVAWYTLFHVAAFVVVGVIVSAIVAVSERIPGVLAGLLLFFAVFEVGFYLLTLFLSRSEQFGSLAWYQIGAANLLAAALMGRYLWWQHPELPARAAKVLEGRV
jgi:hypothetical protein